MVGPPKPQEYTNCKGLTRFKALILLLMPLFIYNVGQRMGLAKQAEYDQRLDDVDGGEDGAARAIRTEAEANICSPADAAGCM